jgi:hypothetical protein
MEYFVRRKGFEIANAVRYKSGTVSEGYPMTKTIVFSALFLASTSFAGTPVKSITDPTLLPNVTQIERSIVIDPAFEGGRLSIIETDNGGSTDTGSISAPSEIYLTYYADGEMRNFAAAFDLGSVYSVDSVKKSERNTDVYVIEATLVNSSTLRRYKSQITVDVSSLRTAIANTETSNDEDFGTTYVEASVSVKGN